MSATVTLCTTCGAADPVPALTARLAAEALPVAVRGHPCLNLCAAPPAIALQGPGRASYLFHGIDPVRDAADIAATLRLYLAAPSGWIEDASGCGRLRDCLAGRIPPL